jgi:hypothetical protein
MPKILCSRRQFIASLSFAAPLALVGPIEPAHAWSSDSDAALVKKFNYLNENGNSNCSGKFMKSIATMPVGTRLQGSCCAPMDAHRYVEQVRALRKYSAVSEIPNDPYDVSAELAKKVMTYYDMPLGNTEQTAYDFAMQNSDENGPCCCKCWRWHVYGGLGKHLVHDKEFDGPQLVEVWNLSSGCGGGAEHHH